MPNQPSNIHVPDPSLLTTEQLRRELSAQRDILETRLNAMDRATKLLDETVNRTPTIIQSEIAHVRELINEKLSSRSLQADERFGSLRQQLSDRDARFDATNETTDEKIQALADTVSEKFSSIEKQFTERDIRTDQAATASAQALAAALQAAKEAVFEQAQAAAKAAEKTELSFTKQIDQIQLQIKTIGDGFGDRLAELKERIDRGEGAGNGVQQAFENRHLQAGTEQNAEFYQKSNTRAIMGNAIAVLAALISVVAVIVLVTHH